MNDDEHADSPGADSQAPNLFDRLTGVAQDSYGEAGETQATVQAAPAEQPAPEQRTADDAQGATGRLPPEARRALVALMRHGVIMASDKRVLFDNLCRHQPLIEDHLADMYLRLLVDPKAGLAMLLQQDASDEVEEEVSSLVTRRTLSLYDTLLLLVLRKHYQERETAGEQRIFIDIERIEAQLSPFLPLTQSTRTDRQRLSGALKRMTERRLLSRARGEEERFEITPVIRYVVNAEFLEELLEKYHTLAQAAGLELNANEGRA